MPGAMPMRTPLTRYGLRVRGADWRKSTPRMLTRPVSSRTSCTPVLSPPSLLVPVLGQFIVIALVLEPVKKPCKRLGMRETHYRDLSQEHPYRRDAIVLAAPRPPTADVSRAASLDHAPKVTDLEMARGMGRGGRVSLAEKKVLQFLASSSRI
ncbi:hypothetical protein B0H14DRAFT_3015480, partial [Mycena olivaceomarginata]